ncbi:MAG TPA: lytic transglycosylase [Aquificaceae bacterium]|nr:lytic transglycosylase [Aquificaceae bacterium]HIQ48089.1 lytic transglycosylase [Aquifex aeolicus]
MVVFFLLISFILTACTPKTKEVVYKRNFVVVKEGKWGLNAQDFWYVENKAAYFGVYNLNRKEVEKALQKLLKDRKSLQYAFYRMSKYENLIVPILRKYGLPEELKYLPIVESMYNPFAISKSGAAGIWQLMPLTAKRYGLKISKKIDERFDIIKSTEASARYLRDLFKEFKNLELVLAAYNCGEGCVRRKAKGDFWKNKKLLPEETRQYVPLFFAVLHIARNPERYGLYIPKNSERIRVVKVRSDIEVKTFLHLYGIKEETFRDLNPHIRGRLIPKDSFIYLEEKYFVKRHGMLHPGRWAE